MRAARAFIVRTIRAVRILARDGRIPRPLRGAAALGLLPIPGPFDEAVLLVVALFLWAFYRERLVEAWGNGLRDRAVVVGCVDELTPVTQAHVLRGRHRDFHGAR